MYCLPRPFAKKLMDAISSGKLNPEKLNKMNSSEVREFLEPIVGKENAKEVNLLYEKTKLLKIKVIQEINVKTITCTNKCSGFASLSVGKSLTQQVMCSRNNRLWRKL